MVTQNNNKVLWKNLIFFFKSNGLAFSISFLQSYFDFVNITYSTWIQKRSFFKEMQRWGWNSLTKSKYRVTKWKTSLLDPKGKKKVILIELRSAIFEMDIYIWCFGRQMGINQGRQADRWGRTYSPGTCCERGLPVQGKDRRNKNTSQWIPGISAIWHLCIRFSKPSERYK